MKNIYSCLIILTFFASCTQDEKAYQEIIPAMSNRGGGDILPRYSANQYDNAGRIYDEIFDSYYDGTSRSTDVQSVIAEVESIANANASFESINALGYETLSTERVQYLASRTVSDIGGVIGASDLSATAKISFSNFLLSFVALYSSEIEAVKMYDAVVKYESTVIASNLFTENDKRIMLTTTSIVRHTSYRAKKKPKKNTDPDWLISVGHAFGTEEGAEENEAKAIVVALATGIVSNK
ncbi:MAG: hypothetical protein M0D53_00790 [Flavobacterium sp. JAD_PAG50586_2]|nr:MAG: hypothetical protein M0D53_00790 [Flavobacterium sp. JAD_PAG50586_2]